MHDAIEHIDQAIRRAAAGEHNDAAPRRRCAGSQGQGRHYQLWSGTRRHEDIEGAMETVDTKRVKGTLRSALALARVMVFVDTRTSRGHLCCSLAPLVGLGRQTSSHIGS